MSRIIITYYYQQIGADPTSKSVPLVTLRGKLLPAILTAPPLSVEKTYRNGFDKHYFSIFLIYFSFIITKMGMWRSEHSKDRLKLCVSLSVIYRVFFSLVPSQKVQYQKVNLG